METYVKKSTKVAGTLCAAAGVISVAISGAALAIAVKSIKYAKDAVSNLIIEEGSTEIPKNNISNDVVEVSSVEATSDSTENTEEKSEF